MNDSNVIDVSGFFLFEATGDSSEVLSSVLDEDSAAADHEWGEDDAQSCSGRVFGEVDDAGRDDEVKSVSSCLRLEENYEYEDGICDAAGGGGGNETDEEDDGGDDDDEEVNQRWIMSVKRGKKEQSKMWPLGVVRTRRRIKPKKSKACNLEMMSEKDRDRLFWEACLSSS